MRHISRAVISISCSFFPLPSAPPPHLPVALLSFGIVADRYDTHAVWYGMLKQPGYPHYEYSLGEKEKYLTPVPNCVSGRVVPGGV